MRKVGSLNCTWATVTVLFVVVINICDGKSNSGGNNGVRSRRYSPNGRSLVDNRNNHEQKYKFDLNRKISPVKGRRNSGRGRENSKVLLQPPIEIRDRLSRQIKPLSCKVPNSDEKGTCMFVFDCNQANGKHLGTCMDRFYIGSCCKLPEDEEDDNFNEILPKPKPTTTTQSTTSPSSVTESVTESTFQEEKRKPSKTTPKPKTTTTTKFTTVRTPTISETIKSKNRTELRDADFFSENGTLLISDSKLICGRQFLPASRIVGGNDAYYGKFPWQISVRTWQNEARTFIHSCGAALLNENWAISAAHCFDRVLNQDVILRMGDWDLSSDNVPFNYTERRIQLVIPHPKFFGPSKTFEYDLALIRFYEPVVFQPNIVPICIPSVVDDYVGRTGIVTGWGRLYEGGPIPARLNEVQVPIMNNSVCEEMFLKAGYIEKIPQMFLCAGWPEGGKDSCEGDSGGPLILETGSDHHWTLIGVISWGIGCSRVSHPGVYSRITEFLDWINLVSEF